MITGKNTDNRKEQEQCILTEGVFKTNLFGQVSNRLTGFATDLSHNGPTHALQDGRQFSHQNPPPVHPKKV